MVVDLPNWVKKTLKQCHPSFGTNMLSNVVTFSSQSLFLIIGWKLVKWLIVVRLTNHKKILDKNRSYFWEITLIFISLQGLDFKGFYDFDIVELIIFKIYLPSRFFYLLASGFGIIPIGN